MEAMEMLTKCWGVEIANQIKGAAMAEYKKMTFDEFFDHCITCGGNWGGMFLSGIKELFPTVWEIIPDNMGAQAFACLCYVMDLCGVSDD